MTNNQIKTNNQTPITLSVVIPCYNEEENLKRGVLEEVWQYLKEQKYGWEVIVADDGSTDKSAKLVADFAKKHPGFFLIRCKHGGKPLAIWAGIQKAQGKIVLFTDMDQSTPIAQVEKLLPWFDRGYQIVIGSRGKKREGASLLRQILARGFRFVRRLLVLPHISDTQCGFKAFRRKVALQLFPRLSVIQQQEKEVKGWRVSAFDVELLFLAQKLGYKIKEVEVAWQDRDVAQGKSKRFLKESWQMAREIFRVKLKDILGEYER